MNKPITTWNDEDKPREKLLAKGKSNLSDAELLAILIGSGTPKVTAVELCSQILDYVNNDLSQLGKLAVKDLMKFKGIGEAKAISIVAAMELGRRRQAENLSTTNKIKHSSDIYKLFIAQLSDLIYEEFWVLFLNNSNTIIGKEKLSTGGMEGTVVDVRMLFKYALERLASSVVLIHNHPSGSMRASQADIKITKQIKEAGQLLNIKLIDHIIVSYNGYYSFADNAML
ncbi:MAG: DNA repair protein RadC [Bacteroidetes bacterium]|nr:DNA repair protein RadC [Bacteroidota bacterium]MCB9225738.1 DNA repair protein RadC [Chitinophagales bacterium]